MIYNLPGWMAKLSGHSRISPDVVLEDNRSEVPRLEQLQAIPVPNRKYCYRPFLTDVARPDWWKEVVRLTHSICIDARLVTATGVDTGRASALTWAEVKALEVLYSAQVCVLMEPYEAGFGGYTNTDPLVTDGGGGQSDAAHVASIATKFGLIRTNYIDALGGSVRTVFLDTESLPALPNTAANAASNDALKLKFQNIYDKVVHATTGFPNCTYVNWYGLGGMWQDASANPLTPVSATDGAPGGPYPGGYRWGKSGPWVLNHYDETDVTPPYTAGGSIPFIEVANAKMTSGPVLFRPQDYEAVRQGMFKSDMLYGASGVWAALSRPLIPWMTLGVGMAPVEDTTSQPAGTVGSYGAMFYPRARSFWYGVIMDDAFHATMMPAPVEVIFWEAPNDPRYPEWMDHFAAYMEGAAA